MFSLLYTVKLAITYYLTIQVCETVLYTISYSTHKAGTFFRQTRKCEYLKNDDRIIRIHAVDRRFVNYLQFELLTSTK